MYDCLNEISRIRRIESFVRKHCAAVFATDCSKENRPPIGTRRISDPRSYRLSNPRLILGVKLLDFDFVRFKWAFSSNPVSYFILFFYSNFKGKVIYYSHTGFSWLRIVVVH